MQCYQLAQRRDLPSLSPTSQPRAKRGFSLRRGSEPVRTREIYRSPTGDRWLLARDTDISRALYPEVAAHLMRVTDARRSGALRRCGLNPRIPRSRAFAARLRGACRIVCD